MCMCAFVCVCVCVCVCVRARVPGGAPTPPRMRHGVTGGLVQETSWGAGERAHGLSCGVGKWGWQRTGRGRHPQHPP